jgi:phosphoglycolate phosphatase-like HAD superfamily hydrolase
MHGLRTTAVGLALSLATTAAIAPSLARPGPGPVVSVQASEAERPAPAATAGPFSPPSPAARIASAAPLSGAHDALAERSSPAWIAELLPSPAGPAAPMPGPGAATPPAAPADPLPSWRSGPTKSALLRFVREAGQPGGPGAIPLQERLAVFDHDGTLWSEQPLYFPFQFCVDRIRAMAAPPPQWRQTEPYASALRGDVRALLAQGSSALGTLLPACSAGLDIDTYAAEVRRWLATARHPITGLPYTAMVYQPMLELLRFLRAAGFRTVIVSGGDSEFMRPWTAAVYGIPPEQVIGSRLALAWQQPPGQPPRLLRQPTEELVVDGPNKPIAIQQTLGRRPVAAFGNSDGDLQMLEWTSAGAGPRLALLVHHTDARREWAYDRSSLIGRLDKGLDRARERGWLVVDMARDWLQVYPRQSPSP